MSFRGHACSILTHLSWTHIELPGVGPPLCQTVPNLLCTHTAHLEGVFVWVLGCEPAPAWASNPYRCDLWRGARSPWTSPFSPAKWCIWHVVKIKQNNYISWFEQGWLLISAQYGAQRCCYLCRPGFSTCGVGTSHQGI